MAAGETGVMWQKDKMSPNEIIHIAVDSFPKTTVSWIELSSGLLTPIIAIIAVYIAYQQYKTNEQRFRSETYERRLRVYKTIQNHLSKIVQTGKITLNECQQFYTDASEADLLFDKTVINKIECIYKRSAELVKLEFDMSPNNKKLQNTEGPNIGELSQKNLELLDWHFNQLEEVRKLFIEKMGLNT